MTAFCDMVPCSLLEVNRRFKGVYSLHAPLKRRSTKRLQGTTSQKAVIFILAEISKRILKSLLAEALVRQTTYTPTVLKQYSSGRGVYNRCYWQKRMSFIRNNY
jgi:hypothetical protein